MHQCEICFKDQHKHDFRYKINGRPICCLENEEIFRILKNDGVNPGPVNYSTAEVYRRFLKRKHFRSKSNCLRMFFKFLIFIGFLSTLNLLFYLYLSNSSVEKVYNAAKNNIPKLNFPFK